MLGTVGHAVLAIFISMREKQSLIYSLCVHVSRVKCTERVAIWKRVKASDQKIRWILASLCRSYQNTVSLLHTQAAGGPKRPRDGALREPSLGDVLIFSSGM